MKYHMIKKLSPSLKVDLDVEGFRRAEQFDNVLRHYYGDEWQSKFEAMKTTPAVSNYLQHLIDIERQNPYLLAAYIYHL